MPKKIVGILTEYLVENFDEACIGIDKEGRIHFFNRAAAALFGVDGDALLGQKLWDALEMSDFTRSFVRVVKAAETQVREQLVVMPDQRALQAWFYPVRVEGRLTGAVAVIRDVSSIRRIERDVTTLVARISDELKIPLTSIKGYIETLLEGAYTEPAILRKFLQIVNEETNRMARLLVGLMDAGEPRRSPADAPTAAVALAPLVRAVASSLAPLAQQKAVHLEVDVPDSLPAVRANDALLRQALTNLLDNAFKFSGLNAQLPEKAAQPGRVRVLARQDAAGVLIEVQDNGIGIPSDEMQRIFERFHRVTSGAGSMLGGTGLGLTIAREIVDGCGGRIDVRSTLGEGSTFVVTLQRHG